MLGASRAQGERGCRTKGKTIRAQEDESQLAGEIRTGSGNGQLDALSPGASNLREALVSAASADPVLDAVAEALSELVPHERLALYQADGAIRNLRGVWGGGVDAAAETNGAISLAGIAGKVIETREPYLLNEVPVERGRFTDSRSNSTDPESLLAVPLLAQGEVKGVLCLHRTGAGRSFTVRELKLAVLFGDMAALAVDNAEIRATLEAEVVTDHLTGLHNHRFFQERLAEELSRAHRHRSSVALIMYDIDDFKRVNDAHGHQMGDRVLQSVASVSRETCRVEDVICRMGGEEFAIILPGSTIGDATALAERVREGIRKVSLSPVGGITVSLGVAEGPLHASSPRELITCADFALLEAKRTGKDRVREYSPDLFDDGDRASAGDAEEERDRAKPAYGSGTGIRGRLAVLAARGEARSLAELRMIQSLSTQLNRLNDVKKIGQTITAELRSLIDYNNCQVHLLHADGETLVPVGFRGELLDYQMERFPALVGVVGHGVSGHVAQTGESYYTPNATEDRIARPASRRRGVDESILGVPLTVGEKVIGTIVVSKLGVDQFDEEDMRLLEGLASQAAIALENAQLLEREREAASLSSALLRLSERLTTVTDTEQVMNEALAGIPGLLGCSSVGIWLLDQKARVFRLVTHQGFNSASDGRLANHEVPWDVAEPFILSHDEPFVLPREVAATVPEEYRLTDKDGDALVAPMKWAPSGLGAIVMLAPGPDVEFSQRDLNFARGIADITSLALGNAARFDELEEAYLSTVAALATALEAKDEYTGSHARALAELSVLVGKEMGLEEEPLKWLQLGALFHDIGKIGVRNEIIMKPGRLTAAERKEMNRHPEIGEQILTPVPFLRPLLPIVRSCHERWDGKGYPDGLSGEQIPLEARIIFVCDAYHAMTTNRPYRKGLSDGEAIRRLMIASGTQFDPDVVAAFARIHSEGRFPHH